jgi:hypothetical protein
LAKNGVFTLYTVSHNGHNIGFQEKCQFFPPKIGENRRTLILGVDVMITIFLRFSPIFCKKMAFFLKTNVMIHFLQNSAEFFVKNANLFTDFFGENVKKVITLIPGSRNRYSKTQANSSNR